MSHDQLQRPVTNPDESGPTIDTKGDKKKGFTRRRITAGIALTAVLAGGGGYAANRLMLGEPDGTKNAPELVLGDDGQPLKYVEYSDENSDRNHDGFDDGFTDVNENNVSDQDEVWNQETQEFSDPLADKTEAAYDNASAEDKANMEEILGVYPEMGSDPHWVIAYTELNPRVKEYMMTVLHHPERYDNEQEWHFAIKGALDVTTDDLDYYENN